MVIRGKGSPSPQPALSASSLPPASFPKPRAKGEGNFTHPYVLNNHCLFFFSFAIINLVIKGFTRQRVIFWCLLVCGPPSPKSSSAILSYYRAYKLFFSLENLFIQLTVIANSQTTPDNKSRKPWCSQRNVGSNPSSGTYQLGHLEQATYLQTWAHHL